MDLRQQGLAVGSGVAGVAKGNSGHGGNSWKVKKAKPRGWSGKSYVECLDEWCFQVHK
jgi:hypothetical protein